MKWLLAIPILFAVAATARGESALPPALRDIGIDQKLDAQVPVDLVFKDEAGRDVKLGDYLKSDRPVILTLVYFRCPMLCSMVMHDLLRSLNGLSESVGENFDVLTVSFDPRETPQLAADNKRQTLREYRRPGAENGWHFLTGSEASIKALTDAVGFRYAFDEKFDQYVHASGIMILTPGGKISRYFFGIDYAPTDLRRALNVAADGQIASPVERVFLYCFHYDPTTGRYSLIITRVLQLAAIATVVGFGSFLMLMRKRSAR